MCPPAVCLTFIDPLNRRFSENSRVLESQFLCTELCAPDSHHHQSGRAHEIYFDVGKLQLMQKAKEVGRRLARYQK